MRLIAGREIQLLAGAKGCRKYSKRNKAGVATSGSGFDLKSEGSSPRIIRVSYSSASEVCPGLPLFSTEGYVDDQLIIRYESHTEKMHPRVQWINTLEKDDPNFFNATTEILQKDQKDFQENVQLLQKRYNQSGGFHIVQMMIFCEIQEDGKRSGRWKYGYDGRNFLEYDMETDQWTTADKEAQGIKRKWECTTRIKQRFMDYLESYCLEWLQKNDYYGSKSFLRKERPVVVMSSRTEAEDGMETHVCQIHGFHPKEIDASWRRDGEVWEEETFRGFLAPNADGTYHYWLSIRIEPKERGHYRCHVEHDSLPEPLDLELKVPGSNFNLWLIIGGVVGGIVACGVAGIFLFLRFRKGDDKPRNDPLENGLAVKRKEEKRKRNVFFKSCENKKRREFKMDAC